MKALTLWRPWPYAIFHLGKRVENRGWPFPVDMIGQTIAIHAGKKWDREGERFIRKLSFVDNFHYEGDEEALTEFKGGGGKIVGTIRLAGCERFDPKDKYRWQHYAPWTCGPYCWLLAEPVELLIPITCRGSQGLWNVPLEIERQVLADSATEVVRNTKTRLEEATEDILNSLTPKERTVLRERFKDENLLLKNLLKRKSSTGD